MYIRRGVSSNCSEAVFRFYTTDPIDIKNIIEKMQRASKIEMKKIEDRYGEDRSLWKDYKENVPLFYHIREYENFRFTDGGQVLYRENNVPDSFIIRIRHDGLKRNKEWTEYIKKNNIIVEDAVYSEDLRKKYARDCVNSIDYWDDYEGAIEHPLSELEIKTKEVLEK